MKTDKRLVLFLFADTIHLMLQMLWSILWLVNS